MTSHFKDISREHTQKEKIVQDTVIYTYILGINESLESNKYRIFRRSLSKCYFVKMLIEIVGILFNLKFQVLSFTSTQDACDTRCNDAGGKLPYLHQVRDDSNRRGGSHWKESGKPDFLF